MKEAKFLSEKEITEITNSFLKKKEREDYFLVLSFLIITEFLLQGIYVLIQLFFARFVNFFSG